MRNHSFNEEYNAFQRSKAITIANDILAGKVPILEGNLQIYRLLPELTDDRWDPDLLIFIAVESETDHLPIGDQRKYWNPDVLKEKDKEIQRAEEFYRDRIFEGCRKLIKRFSSNE